MTDRSGEDVASEDATLSVLKGINARLTIVAGFAYLTFLAVLMIAVITVAAQLGPNVRAIREKVAPTTTTSVGK